jgi:hypothetical protein
VSAIHCCILVAITLHKHLDYEIMLVWQIYDWRYHLKQKNQVSLGERLVFLPCTHPGGRVFLVLPFCAAFLAVDTL